jgi:dynein heavy chain
MQGMFLFSLIWTVGGTMDGDSRKKFDAYFRNIVSGTDPNHPKPKSCKISKVQNTSPIQMIILIYSRPQLSQTKEL